MSAMTLHQVLNLSIRPVATWLRVRRLRALRATALRHIDVAQDKIANEQENVAHFQKVEMHARNALRDFGVSVEAE